MDTETLAHRLRALRQRTWDTPLTQPALGELLGVKAPTISSWERAEDAAVPPDERLTAYATLFASRRSLDESRLIEVEELSPAERERRSQLLDELRALRQRALDQEPAPAADLWHFADGAPVRIICGKVPEPPATASGSEFNYMALSAYADLDALLELHGHVRSRNPDTDVRVQLAARLEDDDFGAHLVVLGNLALAATDLLALLPDVPRQVTHPDAPEGEVFISPATSQPLLPRYAGRVPHRRVVEDVGMLARLPSPLDAARTLTLISGTYTRGVYGAVRCLTDVDYRDDNTRQIRTRFPDPRRFGLLMRVRGFDHAIATPRLRNPNVVLEQFTP
jgi:transcriptional regulator with XRE-family HTH domain